MDYRERVNTLAFEMSKNLSDRVKPYSGSDEEIVALQSYNMEILNALQEFLEITGKLCMCIDKHFS